MQHRVIAGAVPALHNRLNLNNDQPWKFGDILPDDFPFEAGEAGELIRNGFIEEITKQEVSELLIKYTVTENYLKAYPDCGYEVGQEIELPKSEAAAAKKLK